MVGENQTLQHWLIDLLDNKVRNPYLPVDFCAEGIPSGHFYF